MTTAAGAMPAIASLRGAVEVRGITKLFGATTALDHVDLGVAGGQIHAVLGENGAGKSTLIKILTGVIQPDAGEIQIGGEPGVLHSPRDARRRGISLVPQEILMVPHLSVGRNIILGLEGAITRRTHLTPGERARTREALDRVGATYDEETPAARLSMPELRLAQLARALVDAGDVIVLDEPTAVLSESDAEHLLARLEQLRDQGKAVVYVTHRLSEVLRLADRVTVLRDGRSVGALERSELDKDRILALMSKTPQTGHDPTPRRAASTGDALLTVDSLTREPFFRDVDLTVRGGQVIGIAGVQGSGHGHLLSCLAGQKQPDAGSVYIGADALADGSVRRAYGAGVVLVPADRRAAGIVGSMSIRANLALPARVRRSCRRLGLRWPRRERRLAKAYSDSFSVRASGIGQQAGLLSGGNQQKLALARAVEASPRVLLVDEPTQGIDVNAKREIRNLLRAIGTDPGRCVVVASSEFEDLIEFADEVYVMRQGRIAAQYKADDVTYDRLLESALP